MIFATVGSHPTYRFQRLLDALEPLPPGELVVQYGPARPPPGVAEAHAWLTFDQVLEQMERASAVISHAGAGTILCAHNLGHIPIVMPRLRRFGETVDDHQVELARVFERTGQVRVAWEADDLARLVAETPASTGRRAAASLPLHAAVRAALLGSDR